MFCDPADEETLCQVLKPYVEEWGPDAVIVSVPRAWRDVGRDSLGKVRLEFNTVNSVSIAVEHWSGRICFKVELRKAG